MNYKKIYKDREKSIVLGYRLRRRSREVVRCIRMYKAHHKGIGEIRKPFILDVGCSDGLMLKCVRRNIECDITGIDSDSSMFGKSYVLNKMSAENIQYPDNIFDIIYSTATIEHLMKPNLFIKEAYRVLKPGGIIIITTPNKHYEKIASTLGILSNDDHHKTYTLHELKDELKPYFNIIEAKRFMFWPFCKLPFEDIIERAMTMLGLSFLMCNQLVVGRKEGE